MRCWWSLSEGGTDRAQPEIAARPELADEVIYKLRAILISVNYAPGQANEKFFMCLAMGDEPPGENNRRAD